MGKLMSISLLALLLGACASPRSTASPAGSASPIAPTPAPRYAVATGANDLILRVATGGGFVPMNYLLSEMPEFSLYGDGRVVVPGPVAAIYPTPLLPSLRVVRVTPAEIQKIVAAADEAGLLGPDADYSTSNVSDAPTTIFTLTVDGTTHRVSAYALTIAAQFPNQADGAARAKLMAFDERILNLSGLLGRQVGNGEAFAPAGLRVFVRKADTTQPTEPAPTVVAWPLAGDPATLGQNTTVAETRCVLVTGQDLTTFANAAAQANSLTIWTYGAARYSIAVRPLFPDETGCGYEKLDPA